LWYLAWTHVTLLALLFLTWPLWWGPTLENRPFPQVPVWSALTTLPVWVDRLAVVGLLGATVFQAIGWLFLANHARLAPGSQCGLIHRGLVGLTILSSLLLLGLVLANQHRLQPWVYLAWWINLVWLWGAARISHGGRGTEGVFAAWRWLVISVYVFSAISKFDYTFLRTLGGLFLSTLWAMIPGVEPSDPAAWRLEWLLVFPSGELLLAAGLAWGRFPRIWVVLSVSMHGILWLVLGPWGLNHQPGVWIWNLFFIGQAWLLFWPWPEVQRADGLSWWRRLRWREIGVLMVPVGLPLLQPFGGCDHWLAWELYAPRGSRVQVFLAAPLWENSPGWAEFLAESSSEEHGDLWRELRLDQWSLRQLHAPIYPEDRFQLGVALAVAKSIPEPGLIRVQWYAPADRWTGQRHSQLLRNQRELEVFARRFLVNVRPRW
jgi:hypothetical protein